MASLIDPEKMAQTIGTGLQFGTDPNGIAQQLRKLADGIEAGEVLIQKTNVYHTVDAEDFKLSAIVLQFAEVAEAKRKAPLPPSV